ncbi:MAG: type II toxin-antitoxin system HicB family antitoxin [Thermodesulfovibrionales bacterium]|nr:type II toxin-antitoxin system HicB family antitoxin [Thermodesulfovibrionales bacterium]
MKMTLESYLNLEYDIIITPEECTDGSLCYRAEHPQLPGCMSHGSNPEEALRNLIEAKRLYIETLLDKGLDVPLPSRPTGGTFSSYQSITTIVVPIEETKKPQIDLPSKFDMPKAVSVAA